MQRLLEIMARLRDPDSGCPWDLAQDFATISPHTIEEAYEVADAIARDDMVELQGELGDLLFQVAFYSQLGEERQLFDFSSVVQGICDKMIRRHPHVFAGETVAGVAEQSAAWERLKADERRSADTDQPAGVLDGVARALPALLRAQKLQKRAAKVAFDWPDADGVVAKIDEELAELAAVRSNDEGGARLAEELGDLLFSCVNLARHLDVDAEQALRGANDKFERRFQRMEQQLAAQQSSPELAGADRLEQLWAQVKRAENNSRDQSGDEE